MADILNAVKSVRAQKENEPPGSQLKAVQSTNTKSRDTPSHARDETIAAAKGTQHESSRPTRVPRTGSDVLNILRSQPDQDELHILLSRLRDRDLQDEFNINKPGPLQAQIINVIVNQIVPDFWPVLKGNSETLVSSLRNVAGLNAFFARIKLLSSAKDSEKSGAGSLTVLLEVAKRLLRGHDVLFTIWDGLQSSIRDSLKLDMAWKEVVVLVASGKIISVVAQAEDFVKRSDSRTRSSVWLANGPDYVVWLGQNIAQMIREPLRNENFTMDYVGGAIQMLTKALNLGYPNHLLKGIFVPLVYYGPKPARSQDESGIAAISRRLPASAKRLFLEYLLRWLSSLGATDLSEMRATNDKALQKDVSSFAALLTIIVDADDTLRNRVLTFMTDPALSSSISHAARRACIASLSQSKFGEDELQAMLDKLMAAFSDQLFINHGPILQQETLVETLLVVAGYIHRASPMALLMSARSSSHMQGVSNRLDSSNPRARWLGMIVATALSSLVDKEGSQMKFGTDEMESKSAKWYLSLVKVQDQVGNLQDFEAFLRAQKYANRRAKPPKHMPKVEQMPKVNGKPTFGPLRPPAQTEIIGDRVTEVLSDESDSDDDLKPYEKPDSDPEDSDEDATLVNRHKARPPVYIRDLMSMLRDDKNHDHFQLGIKHAVGLIRRKSNFGAEVKDHAVELASILCNLQDPFDTEDYDQLKLQALTALLLSDVETMAPWLSRQAFIADYSIAQRCMILSALGLGGRELAGFKDQDELNPALKGTEFPTKRLPPHLQAIYAGSSEASTKQLDAATKSLERSLIQPLALQAADQSTSDLNAVKVRTFSSRMEVERTRRKPTPNQLAKSFGDSFFFPLVNRYQQEIAAYGSSSVYASVPVVLVTFLKTLALLLHASGPATLGLGGISTELWDLLLALRVQAITDISILQAVLFSFLTLLEINTSTEAEMQRLAEENSKQLTETQQWVDMVFERMSGGGGLLTNESGNEDEAKVKTLAAGVLVKTRDIIEAYQKQLVGYSLD